ncbi:mechanosensitive ion channel protein MscS [Alteromonas sp. KS69]|jgi:small conductance mechanosensitive channel|uniref:Small-conductance mechanosensitive channel n=1 Tax=Alteromonas naphthalenivorans TaxID=715451 RepID=F5ZBP1_ALTNA|nr:MULTISPECIES: mechanosensitive ion channel domain-containing protein [Alteromonas]MBB67719.1 mechanosensitive ion channel protein MscS [Rickettsiales bacterium]PHS54250.1 MAG: mechanosensitive ion channel protein MscS [Alteromonas sp.]AEF01970.1 mechanosensitive ion channel MscS [Alteromonas naphthalenivorans]MBO7923752.1 mechanosensitive ion channel [Alteromonas sp. K632G]RUP75838.1 mechanosensitive ion channel protein MscS [Alteromonas sp. KS69]|tara:strand:- start:3475 stop:4317 length:843 start_codon:yes stop_codon:yes gene_type:complete
MEENLSLFSSSDVERYINDYAIPWGINIAMAIVIYVIGRIVVGFILSLFRRLMAKSKYDAMLVDFLEAIISAILMLFVIVASLNQLGVDTTSLVAILGAAGLAIGLSLQDSLKNFAAGVMLLVFKPFKSGDFVEAAGTAGTINKIGIFTTTMATPDNKEIIVPNGGIYSNNITNYSAKETRRVDMVVGIGYDADLRKAKEILNEMVRADERILSEPAPTVAVSELADSSVNFVVRPWCKASDFWGVKFDFTEQVKLRFDQEGISIPFPQMDVHLHKNDSE